MANDIDVGVGIKVTGDPSGAKAVDEALKQVGATAEDVSRKAGEAAESAAEAATEAAGTVSDATKKAIEDAGSISDGAGDAVKKAKDEIKELKAVVEEPPSGGGIKTEVEGLADSLSVLSPEKAKGAMDGLSQAIAGLASGDTTKGLEGLARSLMSVTQWIPNPALAALAGAAVGGIIGAWKLLRDESGETARAVNEFGETVEVEMARIEAWANKQYSFENLKNGIASVKNEFQSAMQVTQAFTDSVLDALKIDSGGRAAGLRQEAGQARASGDDQRAQMLEEEAARRELVAKIAQEKIELEALQSQYDMQREAIKMSEESLAKLKTENQSLIDTFERLQQKSVEWTGNIDAAFNGEARDLLIAKMREEIAARERLMETVNFVESQRPPIAGPLQDSTVLAGVGSVGQVREQFAEIPSILQTIEEFKMMAEMMDAYNSAVQLQKSGYEESHKAILAEGQALLDLNRKRLQAAQEYELAITNVDASVVSSANSIADELTKKVQNGAAALEQAAQAGSGVVDAVESFGAQMQEKGTEAVEQVGGLTEDIGEALGGLKEEAGAASVEIKAGASEFRGGVGEATKNLVFAMTDLIGSSRSMARIAADLAGEIPALAQEIADVRAQASSALAKSSLALSQNRNSRG